MFISSRCAAQARLPSRTGTSQPGQPHGTIMLGLSVGSFSKVTAPSLPSEVWQGLPIAPGVPFKHQGSSPSAPTTSGDTGKHRNPGGGRTRGGHGGPDRADWGAGGAEGLEGVELKFVQTPQSPIDCIYAGRKLFDLFLLTLQIVPLLSGVRRRVRPARYVSRETWRRRGSG